ncbi:enoyl-CoA hydratase-related protein [Maricurvus nonylphenolicus]|uniref:enoyl-CoA hydratase/isomerase family protein n=1 Tax=Maricurvus nonylphenolicus TaxID=1008307 RepID=UPI0036F21DD5
MNYETLAFEIDSNVAVITLNRPNLANAMNGQMMAELHDIAISCDTNPEVRAILLRGQGPIFCAGGDLASFAEAGDQIAAKIKLWVADFHCAISKFSKMSSPFIVAVNGTAAGAGLSLVAMADLVVSGESGKYMVAYTAAGLSPDGSSTYYLPRRIGPARAREMMLTNRMLSAKEALDWGLVNQLVEDDAVDDVAKKLAVKLASGSRAAIGAVKSMLDQTFSNGLESQMELEARSIAELAAAEDGQEGIHAFLNKRKPVFSRS